MLGIISLGCREYQHWGATCHTDHCQGLKSTGIQPSGSKTPIAYRIAFDVVLHAGAAASLIVQAYNAEDGETCRLEDR